MPKDAHFDIGGGPPDVVSRLPPSPESLSLSLSSQGLVTDHHHVPLRSGNKNPIPAPPQGWLLDKQYLVVGCGGGLFIKKKKQQLGGAGP